MDRGRECAEHSAKREQTGRPEEFSGTAELGGSDSSAFSAAVSRWVSLPTRHLELRSVGKVFCCELSKISDKLLDGRSEPPFLSEQRLARPSLTDR